MAGLESLEKNLDDVFVKKAPFQLPENFKKTIVEYLPWINLVLGILSLWSAYSIWRWIDRVDNELIGSVNVFLEAYGAETVDVSPFVWGGLIVMAIQGALYVAAFSPTKARRKFGWDLMFYALLVNIVYSVVVAFTDYGSVGNLIGGFIGSAIGLYFLFQIRSQYKAEAPAAKPKAPTA